MKIPIIPIFRMATYLDIIHPQTLSFFSASQMEPRYHVYCFCDYGSYYECVGDRSGDICDLDIELLPVRIQESTADGSVHSI